ncbi:MAG: lysophospholipid acyltransferase family protein [Candidatus Omnitrophica bacterium]|nr:lysophospholipid acyltransferase family protein [Candidatus Omnitrophota bacterium]
MMHRYPLYSTFRGICAAVIMILFRLKAAGQENIPKRGGFLIASNHVSYLDPVAVGVACPRPLNYMARHDLFKNAASSFILRHSRAFPVKRKSADLGALKEALRRLKNGDGLLVFPEGSRQENIHLSEAEAGVGFLAAKAGVPVVPAFVSGTDRALSRDAKFIKLATEIRVRFGKQIHIEGRMPYQDIAQIIMDSIRHLSC